jgi:hypothetical protein
MSLASIFGCASHPRPYFWYWQRGECYAACKRCGHSPFVLYVRSAEGGRYPARHNLPNLTGYSKREISLIARGKKALPNGTASR